MADLFIYGICTNTDYKDGSPCPKCTSKKTFSQKDIQKIRLGDDFVCKECGHPLTKVTLPKPFWKKYGKAIVAIIVLVLIVFGIVKCIHDGSVTVPEELKKEIVKGRDSISIKLSQSDVSVNVGDTMTILAEVTPKEFYSELIWSSDSNAIATVTSSGLIKAISKGNVTLRAKVKDVEEVVKVEVNAKPESEDNSIISLTIDRTSLRIEVGKSATVVATVEPSEYASKVIWLSEPSSVAEVSPTGVITGKSEGKAKVTAKVEDKEVKVDVTVVKSINPPPPPPPCLDLGYAEYCGPTKVVNGKRVPHGLGGDLEFKGYHKIDLKKASGEYVEVNRGDRMRNCKFDNGRLVQGLIIFSNGEQRWITIGS